jgi:beta-N-acetylhexosaminidase
MNANNLSQLGFNVNFAPAVDLNLNPENPVIGKIGRSYSSDEKIVADHARIWIQAHSDLNIMSTLKHFPGHGSSDADSHYGVTDITNYWKTIELEPFRQLSTSDNKLAIMTAHVLNTKLDSVPATLSKKIITGILRDSLKFDGLVFSDDMHMKAVNAMYSFEDLIKLTLEAGVDIWVYGNNLEYDELIPTKIQNVVLKMVTDGTITKDRIEKSYLRIKKAKKNLGLIVD